MFKPRDTGGMSKNPFKEKSASRKIISHERISGEIIFTEPEVPRLGLISVEASTL